MILRWLILCNLMILVSCAREYSIEALPTVPPCVQPYSFPRLLKQYSEASGTDSFRIGFSYDNNGLLQQVQRVFYSSGNLLTAERYVLQRNDRRSITALQVFLQQAGPEELYAEVLFEYHADDPCRLLRHTASFPTSQEYDVNGQPLAAFVRETGVYSYDGNGRVSQIDFRAQAVNSATGDPGILTQEWIHTLNRDPVSNVNEERYQFRRFFPDWQAEAHIQYTFDQRINPLGFGESAMIRWMPFHSMSRSNPLSQDEPAIGLLRMMNYRYDPDGLPSYCEVSGGVIPQRRYYEY